MRSDNAQVHNTKSASFDLAPTLFWAQVCAVLVLILAYMLCINSTVYNVIERKHRAQENRSLAAALAPLESEYLAKAQTITLERAHDLGLIDVATVHYASRDGSQTLLTSR